MELFRVICIHLEKSHDSYVTLVKKSCSQSCVQAITCVTLTKPFWPLPHLQEEDENVILFITKSCYYKHLIMANSLLAKRSNYASSCQLRGPTYKLVKTHNHVATSSTKNNNLLWLTSVQLMLDIAKNLKK